MTIEQAKQKARELVAQMTAEEKASQLLFNSPAIARLGIHEYNWWNEACHGVARAGTATVFPQAIAMAATFDGALIKEIAEIVATEGRAMYNKSVEFGDRGIFKGLTYWAPNVNIFRDPRWGRGQETYGEDPFLSATLGAQYIRGLQGDGEFLKTAACAKHFAVHSGPEKLRHCFDARVNDHDLYETYLPAFEWAVKAGVAGVMGAYNRTNGEPCSASRRLIGEILRGQWQFNGYFVSDCWAISNICNDHHYTDTMEQAAALALKNGCNLNCGDAYTHLIEAYEQDLIEEEDLTEAAVRLYTTRVLLGEFEQQRPYADIPYSVVDSDAHRACNLKAARESVVLLENKAQFLPLDPAKKQNIAVIGPNALSVVALEGNYNGHASEYVTVADGIRRVFSNASIRVSPGAELYREKEKENEFAEFSYLQYEAAKIAAGADVTVLCLGYDREVEGEELNLDHPVFDHGDRRTLGLPATQRVLAELVCKNCANVIVVVMSGSAVDIGEELRNHAKAVLHAWYPGAQGGLAVAQLLAGAYSPCGKLPVTFYSENNTLPDFCDYAMQGRTYRYMTEAPLYPFGYGLSYTQTVYSDFSLLGEDAETYRLGVRVTNTGVYPIKEKVQIYARYTDSRTPTPNYQLCGIQAVPLAPGESRQVELVVDKYWVKAVDSSGSRITPDGGIYLYAGAHQPDGRSCALCGDTCLEIRVK